MFSSIIYLSSSGSQKILKFVTLPWIIITIFEFHILRFPRNEMKKFFVTVVQMSMIRIREYQSIDS